MALELNHIYHGFRLLQATPVKEAAATAYRFFHEKSGARLLFMQSDDDNKVFSIAFRTPPTDDTGVAHIVEHSTLCGSRKFPLKEPFVELVKGSLNTFLNAMTYPDKTIYPVASRNDKDFHNLMDVYLDAVFYPVMYNTPEVLMQEGWHYEIETPADDLTYSGVVYNEMKGALSSPDDLLESKIMASLFPNTTYGFESGGNPESIPQLTQAMFIDFHKRYYHPSNSYIYLYGDMDIEAKLEFLDAQYLSAFDRIEVPSVIEYQQLFAAPKTLSAQYPVGADESLTAKTFLSLNAVVGRANDPERMLALEILEHALLRTQAGPLKKALTEAKLGKDVTSSFEDGILQPFFSIIINGAEAEKAAEFQTLVRKTLEELIAKGIERELLEASINLLEFKLREADFGQYPKGLIYNLKLMNSWLYDGDPTMYLYYEALVEKMKAGLKTDYFERILKESFIDNSHQTLVVLEPSQTMAAEKEAVLKAALAEKKAAMSPAELEQIIAVTAELKRRQEMLDTPEVLATIPLLKLTDIKQQAEELPCEKKWLEDIKVLHAPLVTNDIAYINLYFDASAVSSEQLPYAFLLTELLGKVSTERYSYAELANQINLHTGGIGYDLLAYTKDRDPDALLPKFKVKIKTLVKKLPTASSLLTEILLGSRFDDEQRVHDLIDQCRSSLEMYLLRSGHQIAASRLASYFSAGGHYNEQGALTFYEFIKDFSDHFSERYRELPAKFAALQPLLFNRNGALLSVTTEAENYQAFADSFAALAAQLEQKQYPAAPYLFAETKKNEGFMTSSQVQYVSKGANFVKLGYDFSGSMRVAETILRYDYLWTRIRVQGGAYGAFAQFKRNGNMMLGSYRDPNLAETIAVFDETAAYLADFSVSDREMDKYIIGTMSAVDAPLTAQMKGEAAAECYIRDISQADRQQIRDEILATRQHDIVSLATLVAACIEQNYICALGGEGKIRENSTIFGELKSIFS